MRQDMREMDVSNETGYERDDMSDETGYGRDECERLDRI
jgi:hypothetical protein